jgi:hypothetical protein
VIELINIDFSRVTRLCLLSRAEGWPFLPALVHAVAERYKFCKSPSSVDELHNERVTFAMGEYLGAPIDELSIFSDGIVIKGRTNTDNLDAFIDDLFSFAREEGFKIIETHDVNRLYESNIMVKSDHELLKVLDGLKSIQKVLAKALNEASGADHKIDSVGIALGADPNKILSLRPNAFRVERRADFEFGKLYYASLAPLPTTKHLAVLRSLETLNL